jgi:hypothetical protein
VNGELNDHELPWSTGNSIVTVGEQEAMYMREVRPPASSLSLSAVIVLCETNPTWIVGMLSPNVVDSYANGFVVVATEAT